LVILALGYVFADAVVGQKLFDNNMFIFGSGVADNIISQVNSSTNPYEGRGCA
jgi:hypothetical protein